MMTQAFVIGVIGYVLCFVVLAVIWAVLAILKLFMVKADKPALAPQPEVQQQVVNNDNNDDESELIAVLTAAIAMSLNTPASELRIKSFKRLPSGLTRWGTASVNENLLNRL